MLGKSIHKLLTSVTAFAVLCVYSNIVFAQTVKTVNLAEITVTGNVSVNGTQTTSGSTIASNSQITTGANSGAVINLGANGKIELFNDTAITLKFTQNSIVAMLTTGKIRVMNAAGIGSTVTTRTATVSGDTARANSYIVSLGCADDKDCQTTFLETTSGFASMITNNDQTLKQVLAGQTTSSGDACSKACVRPGSILPVALSPGIGTGLLAAILGGVGAAALLTVITGDHHLTPGGPTHVVSPHS